VGCSFGYAALSQRFENFTTVHGKLVIMKLILLIIGSELVTTRNVGEKPIKSENF